MPSSIVSQLLGESLEDELNRAANGGDFVDYNGASYWRSGPDGEWHMKQKPPTDAERRQSKQTGRDSFLSKIQAVFPNSKPAGSFSINVDHNGKKYQVRVVSGGVRLKGATELDLYGDQDVAVQGAISIIKNT
jgi:hypothetical protein